MAKKASVKELIEIRIQRAESELKDVKIDLLEHEKELIKHELRVEHYEEILRVWKDFELIVDKHGEKEVKIEKLETLSLPVEEKQKEKEVESE